MPTNRQKCDYYLRRMDDPTPGPCDPSYAADGQRGLFKSEDFTVSDILVAGIDPGPSKHGLAVRGPAVRAFRAPVLFAGECDTEELLARLRVAGDALGAVIIEWPRTIMSTRIRIKPGALDATIGAAHVLRDRLKRELAAPVYCVPRQNIISQLGVKPFTKGSKDSLVAKELMRQGYDDDCICNSHTRAALAAALLNYRHPENARYLAA